MDADGEPVLLDRQDRALWDHAQIEEGCGLIADALRQGPPGPYAVQAAIAALHGEASSGATTDWPQIAALYDVLYSLRRTPVVALNRAVAVAEWPAVSRRVLPHRRDPAGKWDWKSLGGHCSRPLTSLAPGDLLAPVVELSLPAVHLSHATQAWDGSVSEKSTPEARRA